jgi:general L-amino acid transport system substrate-binding protein
MPLRVRLAGLFTAAMICGAVGACGGREEAPPPAAPSKAAPPPAAPAKAEAVTPRKAGPTITAIKARGRLVCGVHEGLLGFAYLDNRGQWRGFDVDFCRATAAAVLGDAAAVRFVPTGLTARFEALQGGRVDVLWRSTSFTFGRDSRMDFPAVNYYDGQGFLVRRSLDLASATELNGARVCVQAGSSSEGNLADFFRARGLNYTVVSHGTEEHARAAYAEEGCDAYTADISTLAAARTTLSNPGAHVILPEVISKEPLGPVVREGDDQWADVVRWTLAAMVLAEELGVTSKNVDEMRETATSPEVRRLLGVEGDLGVAMGLTNDWAYRVIKHVGNYGEVFDRNVGVNSPLKLERGLNALWNAQPSGLMFAPPLR